MIYIESTQATKVLSVCLYEHIRSKQINIYKHCEHHLIVTAKQDYNINIHTSIQKANNLN